MDTVGTRERGTAADGASGPGALPGRRAGAGRVVVDWLTTTDHKKIGTLYLVTAFVFFLDRKSVV